MGCVYKLTSPSGKSYIGLTLSSLGQRIKRHVYQTNNGRRNAINLAFLKYGVENFTKEILFESDDPLELRKIEEKYVRELNTHYPNGYNLTYGGEYSGFWGEEVKLLISKRAKQNWAMNYDKRKAATKKSIIAFELSRHNPAIEAKRKSDISATMKQKAIAKGEHNNMAKLKEQDVSTIKKMIRKNIRTKCIASMFKVDTSLIYMIKNGKRWAYVN